MTAVPLWVAFAIGRRARTLSEAHRIAHEAQHRLVHDLTGLSDATVHVSPAAGYGTAAHEAVAHHGLPSARAEAAPSG